MSSILDALNKLEEEKAARRAELQDDLPPASPEDAAAELIGASSVKVKRHAPIPVWIPIFAALLAGILITAVMAALLIRWAIRPDHYDIASVPRATVSAPSQTYTVPIAPSPANAPAEQAPAPPAAQLAPVAPAVQQPTPAVQQPTPAVQQPTPAPPSPAAPPQTPAVAPAAPPAAAAVFETPPPPVAQTSAVSLPEESQETSPRVEAPAAAPKQETTPLPSLQDIERVTRETVALQPPVAPTPAAPLPAPSPPQPRPVRGEADVDSLPRLSSQDRSRLGLDSMRLNVLREATADQPDAMAIINLKKVYVGEMIPNTRIRLIGVKASGIGVEVEGSGERFRIPR